MDPAGHESRLSPDCSDEELGFAIEQSLARSRFLEVQEIGAFFDPNRITLGYESWVASLLLQYGHKTRRSVFKNMALCNIAVTAGQLEITPTRHQKLEAWGRDKDDGITDTVLSATCLPAEVGAALRAAFGRCG